MVDFEWHDGEWSYKENLEDAQVSIANLNGDGEKGYGFAMQAPLSKLALHMAGCGFVDDTEIIQTGLDGDDYWSVADKLQ